MWFQGRKGWLEVFGILAVLCAAAFAANGNQRHPDGKYFSSLHSLNDENEALASQSETMTKWQWLLSAVRPSQAFFKSSADLYRFLDRMDDIYRFVVAGERTRLVKRDPAMANQVDSLLRETGAYDQPMEEKENIGGKRSTEANEDNLASPCGAVGYLGPAYLNVSKCPGRNCKVSQLKCPGDQYYNATNMPSSLGDCQITKLKCADSDAEVDFSDRTCQLQKWNCPDASTQFDPRRCLVQLQCSNSTFFGYEAWDFFCENEDLVCDGAVVSNPNGTSTTRSNCSVRKVPCEDISDFSTCRRITEECTNDPVDNLCPRSEDRTLVCDSSSIRPVCDLDRIVCLGTEYEASKYTGPLALCEMVKSIKCRTGPASEQTHVVSYSPGQAATPTQFCRVVELDCEGIPTPFVNSIPTGCSIKRVVCADISNISSGCISWSFGCQSAASSPSSLASSCKYQQLKYQCHSNCVQPAWRDVCYCPIDFVGRNCTSRRRITCEANLISPQEYCEKIAPLDGEPTCFRTVMTGIHEMEVAIHHCKFVDVEFNNKTLGNFTYEFQGDELAFTKVPNWTLRFKVINFNSFSDMNGSFAIPFPPHMMLGHLTAQFQIPVESLHRRFMPGGRIYGELRIFFGNAPGSDYSPVLLRHIVDVADWEDAEPMRQSFPVAAVVLGLLAGLATCVAVFFAYQLYIRRRAKLLKKLR